MTNQLILTGFIAKGVSSVFDLELTINQMKVVVQETAEEAYTNLFIREIERLVDSISMNQLKRPENISILDAAGNMTRDRILMAGQNGYETEYNLSIGCQVLLGKFTGGKENDVLLKVVANNDVYMKPLRRVGNLIPYNVYSDDIKKGRPKEKIWDGLCRQYPADVPIISSLISYDSLVVNPKDFAYRSPEERAFTYAKEAVLNKLVSQYACGAQIEPAKLMEYVLYAENRIHYQDLKDEIEKRKTEISAILPVITYSLISKSPMVSQTSAEGSIPQEEEKAENATS